MAEKTKKVRLPITVYVKDEDRSVNERRHESGFLIEAANTVMRAVPAGEPVELPASEADALLRRYGPYKQTVIMEEGELPGIPAPSSPPTANVRR